MRLKSIFILLTLAVISFSMQNNSVESRYFVQFKINTLTTFEQAEEINQTMINKSGISASRADHITSTYFCYLKPGVDYSKEKFENWFEGFGYSITCFNKGVDTIDEAVSPHILKNCPDEK